MPTPTWTAPELTPDDLKEAAALCQRTLTPALDRDWSIFAFEMEWSCRKTLDHIINGMPFYAAQLATRATSRLPSPRDGDPNRSIEELLVLVGSVSAILAEVIRATPKDARGFHITGMADGTGFLGLAVEELLMHTDDIARAFDIPYRGSEELAEKVIARIFPWAPAEVSAWQALRWSSGRIALPGRDRLDKYWSCFAAPLSEWDGTIRHRSVTPSQ